MTKKIILVVSVLLLVTLACGSISLPFGDSDPQEPTRAPLLDPAVDPANLSADEPVFVTGTIPFTSPFFMDFATEPFVLLEDQAGFAARDKEFEFPLSGQLIGPVWQIDDGTMGFSLSLPLVPQGTLLDVDNDGQEDRGVMVFGVAFWSNVWGGPFLEKREGTGWSSAYTTIITDPDRDYEVTGGYMVIWAPDDNQEFPTGFGADEMLLTEDDPVAPVPAGYSIVDLNQEPFRVFKQAEPEFTLVEGSSQVKDYSDMSYGDAFDALFEKVSVEYPFTEEKGLDWDALYDEYGPQAAGADNDDEYYLVIDSFLREIPDGHVGISTFNQHYFLTTAGGGLGLVVDQLSDGRIVVTKVIPDTPAAEEGIQVGAEIVSWQGQPVTEALTQVVPFDGNPGTEQALRNDQLIWFNRVPFGSDVDLVYQNPGAAEKSITLASAQEIDSILESYPSNDGVSLPIEGRTLPSGLGYLRINTFSDNENLTAEIWVDYIQDLLDTGVPGLIIDLRINGGGSGGLALNFAGYMFDEEMVVEKHGYYNHELGEFEFEEEIPTKIEPAELYYGAPVALLVSPDCVSACEGFAYYMTQNDRSIVVGHAGTAGAYGEVGRGQYALPGGINLQVPTGRPETLEGELVIEGEGILPDILVPVTLESATGEVDTVLQAAVEALLDEIN